MIILGIETSCDETAAAVLQKDGNKITILSNVVATSLDLQNTFGGVFPEHAAREQLKSIIPVIDQALKIAFPNFKAGGTIVGDDERGAPVSLPYLHTTGGKTEGSRRRARILSEHVVIRQLTDEPVEGEDGRREAVLTGPVTLGMPKRQNPALNPQSTSFLKPNTYNLAPPIDAIAVTVGPGLIGSLLIGVETAKALSLVWQKPLIPVNHLIAHFYANWVADQQSAYSLPLSASNQTSGRKPLAVSSQPTFPALGLLVSGGHTDLVLFQDHLQYTYLGGTRDDAAGECFDKSARLLGLPYPGGPEISKRAILGNPRAYLLPKPMIGSKNFNFSFSGLKTAISTLVDELTSHGTIPLTNAQINDLSASIEYTICQVLIRKTIRALKEHQLTQLMVAGGVAANSTFRQLLKLEIEKLVLSEVEGFEINLHIPPTNLCTDNGVSTAAAGFFIDPIDPLTVDANPNLSLAD